MKMNKEGLVMPKVLVACPTSQRHEHLITEWLEHLDKLNYPVDVLLIDTTPETDSYYISLLDKRVQDKRIKLIRFPWTYKDHIVQHLAYVREEIRKYFLDNNYEYLMSLDDDVFLPEWGIERLLSYNKDCVGYYVHIFHEPNQVPCVLKSGEIVMGKGLEFYTFEEIDAYRQFIEKLEADTLTEAEKKFIPFLVKDKFFPRLFKPYAVNLGCLMIKRKVLEAVPFRTHDTFIFGEDLWWFNEANDKKFEFWCDCKVRCLHKNTEWASVMSKGPKTQTDFSIAIGPVNAQGIDVIDRRLDGDL